MGRVRSTVVRYRVPWPRRLLMDPVALRFWLLAGIAALVVAIVVGRSMADADAVRDGWGRRTPVVVMTATVEAGDALAGSVEVQRWPAALVPAGAVAEVPPDARVATTLGEGMPLTRTVLDAGEDGIDGDLRTISLPLGAGRLPVEEGDPVDVWGSVDPTLDPSDRAPTRRVATGARVVSAAADHVVLAVDPAEVAELAEAVAIASLTLVGTS